MSEDLFGIFRYIDTFIRAAKANKIILKRNKEK